MDIEPDDLSDPPEFSSAKSSYSDFAEFVFPPDIPDGPNFYDLAGHIDQVTQQFTEHPTENCPDTLLSKASADNLKTVPMSSSSDVLDTVTFQDSLNDVSLSNSPVQSNHFCRSTTNVYSVAPTAEPVTCFEDDNQLNDSLSGNLVEFRSSVQVPLSVDSLNVTEDIVALSCDQSESNNVTTTIEYEDNLIEEDFGDFESCTTLGFIPGYTDCNSSVNPTLVNTANRVLDRLLSHLDAALNRIFKTLPDEMVLSFERSHNDEDHQNRFVCHPLSMDRQFKTCIWSQLTSSTRPRNRRHKWNKSAIYEAYLNSIHVPKPSTPVFAQQHELLQPVRLNITHPSSVTDINIEHTVNKSPLAPSDSPKSCNGTERTPIPMDSLDLDFLENYCDSTNFSDNSKPITLSALELELPTEVPETAVSSGLDVSLFAPSSSDASLKPNNLRANVRSVLARLPKLTFMRSHHLNFPISDLRHNS